MNNLMAAGMDPFGDYPDNIPVEYITGLVSWEGSIYKVDSNTLIPRPETSGLIDLTLDSVSIDSGKSFTFADVGTGSGIVGVTLLQKILECYPELEVHAFMSDKSVRALRVARANARRILGSNAYEKIKFLRSDLLVDYPEVKLDLVVANLPYIPSDRLASLDSSVIDYEPRLALDGGSDGLVLIRQLLTQSAKFLSKNGTVVLEVDDTHSTIPSDIGQRYEATTYVDENGKNRYWLLRN